MNCVGIYVSLETLLPLSLISSCKFLKGRSIELIFIGPLYVVRKDGYVEIQASREIDENLNQNRKAKTKINHELVTEVGRLIPEVPSVD